MTDKLLVRRPARGVATLVLNRPQVLNAIDMELFEAFDGALTELEQDGDIRVVVVTGAGERAFSAGFDIREMADFDSAQMRAAFERRDALFWRIAGYAKPVVAALNGVTFGAGALMAAAADLRTGCPATRFKVTASTYGAANATWSLPRLVGEAKAKELLFTGREVGAEEALAIGLLNQLAGDGGALDAALQLARQIADNPAEGVQAAKALIDAGHCRGLRDAYQAEHDWMIAHMQHAGRDGADVFRGFLATHGPQPKSG